MVSALAVLWAATSLSRSGGQCSVGVMALGGNSAEEAFKAALVQANLVTKADGLTILE